jgi:hypothetical protein
MAIRTTALPLATSLTEILGHDGSSLTSRFTLALGAGALTLSGYSASAAQGILRLGNGGTAYVHWDGTSYNVPAGPIVNQGSAVLTKSGAPVVLTVVIDGGGSAITAGTAGDLRVPFAATITGFHAYADQSGSVSIDLQRSSSYPTFATLVGGNPLVLSSATNGSSNLTSWTTSLASGDILRPITSGVATITRLTINLTMVRA